MAPIVKAMINPEFNDLRVLTLVVEIFLTRSPGFAELSPLGRLTSRVAARSARLSRFVRTMVLRYSF
jgi:hypothetical protein